MNIREVLINEHSMSPPTYQINGHGSNGVHGDETNGTPPKKRLILNAFVEMCKNHS